MIIFRSIEKIIDNIILEILSCRRDILILKITLVLLLLHGDTTWASHMTLRVLCIVMLISNKLTLNKYLWLLISLVLVGINTIYWFYIDNHMFLIVYWTIACTIATWHDDIQKILAFNSRILLALAFIFATISKINTLEYFDGSFLNFTFLTDQRMKLLTVFGGGIDINLLNQNFISREYLIDYAGFYSEKKLNSSLRLEKFTLIFSYAALIIEGLIGILFLLKHKIKRNYADYILIPFILITYFFFPIIGFGFILCILGISQVNLKNKNLFLAYFFIFMTLQLTMIPFDKLLLG